MAEKLKVIVVDDASLMRKAVVEILTSDPNIEVIDTASNGLEAIKKIKSRQPDVITLDIDMPIMNGIQAIKHIMIECPVPIVILSSLFSDGAITFDALRLGVVDFIPKPSRSVADMERAKQLLICRTKLAATVNIDNVRRVQLANWNVKETIDEVYRFKMLEYLLAIGTTLSGPNTVIRLLSQISPSLPAAIVVVQEISPKILPEFIKKFDTCVPWKIEPAVDNVPLQQGTCYIGSNTSSFQIQMNPAGQSCLVTGPQVENPLDLLFNSASQVFQEYTIGLLLTGVGDDGQVGLSRIKDIGGTTVAQAAQYCVFPNLTHNAIQSGVVDIVLEEQSLHSTIESLML